MAWFDANDYFVLERAAEDRMQDLEMPDELGTEAPAVFIWTDLPRRIDQIIDYFGECSHRALPTIGSARCVSEP
jgi:hypothetical protein